MEKQITIIIPTYNMEKYIGRCLDSLLIPEFDQVEVLVVNDGSKDRSSEIAHSYADRYPDSIRVIDKPNGNYGSCINAALPQAKGRYVKILDADDTFDTKAFSEFVKELQCINADVIITPFIQIDSEGNITKVYKIPTNLKERTNLNFKEVAPFILYEGQMHSLTYNIDFIKKLKYIQKEGISYTDLQWSFLPLGMGETYLLLSNLYIYRYLVGREGQTVGQERRKLHDLFEVQKVLLNTLYNYTNIISVERKSFFEERLARTIQYSLILGITSDNFENKRMSIQMIDYIRQFPLKIENRLDNPKTSPYKNYKIIRHFTLSKCPEEYKVPFTIRLINKIKNLLK